MEYAAALIAVASMLYALRLKAKVEKLNRRTRNHLVRIEALEKASGLQQTNTDIRVRTR